MSPIGTYRRFAAVQYLGRFSNRPFWVKRLSDYPPL